MIWTDSLCIARASFAALVLGAQVASAAEIKLEPAGARSMPGTMVLTITGEIVPEDVERVAELVGELQKNQPGFEERAFRAILDSPGGNFQAGIDIARIFDRNGVSTIVPEGAECLSACAVIFMAGTHMSMGGEGGEIRDRTVHLPARLGFHRPKIGSLMSNISPGVLRQLPPEQLAAFFDDRYNTAFNNANQMILEMLAVDPGAWETDLILRMLTAVDSDEQSNFVTLATVEDALKWGIGVRNVKPPDLQTNDAIFDAAFALCFNTGPYVPNADDRFWHTATDLDDQYVFNRDDVPRLYGNTRNFARSIEIFLHHEAPMGCRVAFNDPLMEVTLAVLGDDGPRKVYDLRTDLGRLAGHHPKTSLAAIVGHGSEASDESDRLQLSDPNTSLNTIIQQATGKGIRARCLVLERNLVVDDLPCMRLSHEREGGGRLHFFVWPSGSRTVVEDAPERTLINGAAARTETTLPSGMVRCLQNSATGRTFCYGDP